MDQVMQPDVSSRVALRTLATILPALPVRDRVVLLELLVEGAEVEDLVKVARSRVGEDRA